MGSDSSGVPEFLRRTLDLISKEENITTVGIYRQNGSQALIQGLKLEIQRGHMDKLNDVKNVHLLTGLVKAFFRELSEELIPWPIVEKIQEIQEEGKISNIVRRKLQHVLMEIKMEHRHTLLLL